MSASSVEEDLSEPGDSQRGSGREWTPGSPSFPPENQGTWPCACLHRGERNEREGN